MKTKIYLNDWFFNAGIVGFLRILKHNNDNFAEINENYIEFDTANLKNADIYIKNTKLLYINSSLSSTSDTT